MQPTLIAEATISFPPRRRAPEVKKTSDEILARVHLLVFTSHFSFCIWNLLWLRNLCDPLASKVPGFIQIFMVQYVSKTIKWAVGRMTHCFSVRQGGNREKPLLVLLSNVKCI